MLLFTSTNTSQSDDTYIRKNFTYEHDTRTVTAGGGGGAAATLGNFGVVTEASIPSATGTTALVTVANNFTGSNAVFATIGTNRRDGINSGANATVPANAQLLIFESATVDNAFRNDRYSRADHAAALNLADADAFNETGLADLDGNIATVQFGASTVNWIVIGIAQRENNTASNQHGIIWVLPPSAQPNIPNTAASFLSLGQYFTPSTITGLQDTWTFGGFGIGFPSPEEFTINTNAGVTTIQISLDSVTGTTTAAQLNMIAAGQNIIIIDPTSQAEIARGVVDTISVNSGVRIAAVTMTMPTPLTTAALVDFTDYTIVFGPDAEAAPAGGGGGISFTLNDGQQERFVSQLPSIARGDSTII